METNRKYFYYYFYL